MRALHPYGLFFGANDGAWLAERQFVPSAVVVNFKKRGGDIYEKTHFANCQATD